MYKRHISRCDEIGRRARLKIWCGSPHVPVRLRPPADIIKKKSIHRLLFYCACGTYSRRVFYSKNGSHLSQNDT